jgi:glycosyltransferase involved in cell wall biosynthesis
LRARVEYLPEKRVVSRRRAARAHAALLRQRGALHGAALAELAGAPDFTPGVVRRATLLGSRIVRLGSPPLYIHFAHKPGTIGRFAAKLAGVPYALSCHAKDIWLTPPDELAAKVRAAEVVLSCTAAGRDELARRAAGRTPVLLAYHGVGTDVPRIRQARPAPPRILTIGRLVEKKGHDLLIRAAALLRSRGSAFQLRIVGEGVEWARLQRLVHELGVERDVTFLGPLSPDEIEAEYASATVFALASRRVPNGDRDGLPNVVLEAMTHELPLVTTTAGGAAEAVDDEHTGLLVAPEDPDALAVALERVLASQHLAARMGRAARATVCDRFNRTSLLPTVSSALTDAGLIPGTIEPAYDSAAPGEATRAA